MVTPFQNVYLIRERWSGILLAVVLAAIGLTLAGCYQRVVRETGPGSRSDVHQPNLKENPIERIIYGDDNE